MNQNDTNIDVTPLDNCTDVEELQTIIGLY